MSKSVEFSRRAKNVKNRQKIFKSFSTLFDNCRGAPFFRPLLGGSERRVLRRVLEIAFEKVLRRALRRCLVMGFNGKKGSEKGS